MVNINHLLSYKTYEFPIKISRYYNSSIQLSNYTCGSFKNQSNFHDSNKPLKITTFSRIHRQNARNYSYDSSVLAGRDTEETDERRKPTSYFVGFC